MTNDLMLDTSQRLEASRLARIDILSYLLAEGALQESSLQGNVLDIGVNQGTTTDALGYFGGNVIGTDQLSFAVASPAGRSINSREGVSLLASYAEMGYGLSLVSCFNVDWCQQQSDPNLAQGIFATALEILDGQVLFTTERLEDIPGKVIELPNGLNKSEKFVYIS